MSKRFIAPVKFMRMAHSIQMPWRGDLPLMSRWVSRIMYSIRRKYIYRRHHLVKSRIQSQSHKRYFEFKVRVIRRPEIIIIPCTYNFQDYYLLKAVLQKVAFYYI